jgi:ABC transporter substrate binding protein
MKRKITVLALCAMLFALCQSAEAQQQGKVPRIGYQSASSSGENNEEAFRQGLRELIMTNDNDPVGTGFVASLARPGGNITGLTSLSAELRGKLLELLKETLPRLSHVVALQGPGTQSSAETLKETEVVARSLGL